jgi:hypothetical protein
LNGTISPSTTVVNHGANQTFAIAPDSGYEIVSVLADGVNDATAVSTGIYTFSNVTANHTISATFQLIPATTWTVTATAAAGGSISPTGSVVVNDGSDQSFTIIADSGDVIDALLLDGVPVTAAADQASYILTLTSVSADAVVSATFKLAPTLTKKKSKSSCELIDTHTGNAASLIVAFGLAGCVFGIRRRLTALD